MLRFVCSDWVSPLLNKKPYVLGGGTVVLGSNLF
jgi:hypothetical protein